MFRPLNVSGRFKPKSKQILIRFLIETKTGFRSKWTRYLDNVGISLKISFKSHWIVGYLSNVTSLWEGDINYKVDLTVLTMGYSLSERTKYCVKDSAPSSVLGPNVL